MLSSIARILAIGLLLLLCATVGGGLWLGYSSFYAKDLELRRTAAEVAEQKATIKKLEADVAAKERRIERLETAIKLLKVDRRIAHVDVLNQVRKPGEDIVETTAQFVEVDEAGQPIGEPLTFTIDGDLLYIDYWVIKFADESVEQGDPLRSTSIALFRRLFGEYQEPNEGFTIDQPGTRPAAYGASVELTGFQKELWENFWQYAQDAEKAREAGVRAAHGEAPSTQLELGKRYKLMLRASGGFTIEPEDRPVADDNAT